MYYKVHAGFLLLFKFYKVTDSQTGSDHRLYHIFRVKSNFDDIRRVQLHSFFNCCCQGFRRIDMLSGYAKGLAVFDKIDIAGHFAGSKPFIELHGLQLTNHA